jgi:hypothetical protein
VPAKPRESKVPTGPRLAAVVLRFETSSESAEQSVEPFKGVINFAKDGRESHGIKGSSQASHESKNNQTFIGVY